MDCIDKYYAIKLDCQLPWSQKHGNQKFEICKGKYKFDQFRNLSVSTAIIFQLSILARNLEVGRKVCKPYFFFFEGKNSSD